MKSILNALSVLTLALLSLPAPAQVPNAGAPARQDLTALREVAEQFMKVQTSGLSGTVNITVEPVDSRLNLAACPAPQAFLPNGGRLWGRTSIGVKCVAPSPWTIYVRATVQVLADYFVTSTSLGQGQIIGPGDITRVNGDLSNLPNGVITEESQAVGRTTNISLAAGAPLRQDALRSNRVVQQGQSVRVVSSGPGFQITTEARALNNASEGQIAQAKTPAGQVVSGIARAGGIVEITY